MSDFLTRLAQRALGQAPVLEPLVHSWGAPEPDFVDAEAAGDGVEQLVGRAVERVAPERPVPPAQIEGTRATGTPEATRVPGLDPAWRPALKDTRVGMPTLGATAAQRAATPRVEEVTREMRGRPDDDVRTAVSGSPDAHMANNVPEPTLAPAASEVVVPTAIEAQPALTAAPRERRPQERRPPERSVAHSAVTRTARSQRDESDALESSRVTLAAPIATQATPPAAPLPDSKPHSAPAPAAPRDLSLPAFEHASDAAQEPDVNVSITIGRVIVRPASPAPPSMAPARRTSSPPRDPRTSLAQYLASRSRR